MTNLIWCYWLLAIVAFLLYRCLLAMRRRLKQRSNHEIEQVVNCDEGCLHCCRQFPKRCRYLLRANDTESDVSDVTNWGVSAVVRDGAPIATEEEETERDRDTEEGMDTLADGEEGTEGWEGTEGEGEGMEGEGSSVSATMLQPSRNRRRKGGQSDDHDEGNKIGNGFTRILTFHISSLFSTSSTKSTSSSTSSSPTSSSQLLPVFSQDNPMMDHDHHINPTSVNPTTIGSSRTSPGADAERTKTIFSSPRSFPTATHNPPSASLHPISSVYPSASPSPSPQHSPQPRPRPVARPGRAAGRTDRRRVRGRRPDQPRSHGDADATGSCSCGQETCSCFGSRDGAYGIRW